MTATCLSAWFAKNTGATAFTISTARFLSLASMHIQAVPPSPAIRQWLTRDKATHITGNATGASRSPSPNTFHSRAA